MTMRQLTREHGGVACWRARVALLGCLCFSLAGCRHQPVVAAIPIPPPQQLPVDTTAKVEHQPVVAQVPVPAVEMPQVTVPVKKIHRKKWNPAPAAPPAAVPAAPAGQVQVASAGPLPEADVIGALTPGGSDTEQQHRDAAELITQLERRLSGLSSETKKRQREQLMRVKNFQREAQVALNAGDTDGAWTLATKAKVLLDDLVK